MRILGKQFVIGQTIEEALKRSATAENNGFKYSYDMLGEEACTHADAQEYYNSYLHAIETIGKNSVGKDVYNGAGISVKLSALHPRYEWRKREKIINELLERISNLCLAAKQWNLGLTIDAEEADRLDLSLDLFEGLMSDPRLDSWNGLGLAVQAYQKRAISVLNFIIQQARKYKRKIMVRLVKGAYWDAEIKVAQERGLNGYPVFTRKAATDVSYIACVKKILAATDVIYPQFATHNAYTVALIVELAENYKDYEFQSLYGMGDALYANVVGDKYLGVPCRIYAPVGGYRWLLAYLVRRLLENGANTSFVNRIVDDSEPIEDLIADPHQQIKALSSKPHPKIPLPHNLYGKNRPNSHGIDFSNPIECKTALQAIAVAAKRSHAKISSITAEQLEIALQTAHSAANAWMRTEIADRVSCLQKMALLLEQHKFELMGLLVSEGGKTLNDAIAEVREAVDFCWYYAECASKDFKADHLAGPTGESNLIQLHGRGIIACVSPWNFPLAIFLGQVTAALLAGNVVLAKPASQTPLIAAKAVELLHLAGIPHEVIQLLIGSGAVIGDKLISDQRVNGVMFTGSTETARHINQKLAQREGAIIPLIAETGGQNAMIVDSSALAEQVVKDVITSAFGSAGQRCSSLRVLYVQSDVADRIIKMLGGAMAELTVGDPLELSTDIGPVIDQNAYTTLTLHAEKMKQQAKLLYQVALPTTIKAGNYFAPCAFELKSIRQLTVEVFGPILHVIRYNATDLEQVITEINNTQYGLTLGIHSRIDENVDFIIQRAKVGNIYVNRNMIGAVVGVQPFGGEGLSGTGPKAGGPRYVARLATERTVSINTVAAGGNATLMSLQE